MAKKTSDDVYGDKTHEALKNTVPADVLALDTDEARKVMTYYGKHLYWLSEMYLYLSHFRGTLKKVVKQLKDKSIDLTWHGEISMEHSYY